MSGQIQPDEKIPGDHRGENAIGRFAGVVDLFCHQPGGLLLICLLLFGLTVWVFAPALNTSFQFYDDDSILVHNAHVNTGLSWQNLRWALFSTDYSYSYPLSRISHMLDFEMFGPDPWGHHLTNILLHAANAVLLFIVLKAMTGTLWRSFIVALLFALHPLRVESVAWVSERKDVLSAFFGLLALIFYVRYVQRSEARSQKSESNIQTPPSVLRLPSSGSYWLSLLFFALALMSKSMLVTLPCLLLVLDYWPLNRFTIHDSRFTKFRSVLSLVTRHSSLLWEKIPFFLLVVPVSLVTYYSTKGGGSLLLHFPLGFRLETALMGYARYLEKMFWPANFSVVYPYPDFWPASQLLFAAGLVSGISVLAFALRRQRPYLLVGWLWYMGTLVPVIGLIPLGANSIFNRFTYIPMIGILILVVWVVDDFSKGWRHRMLPVTAVVVMLMGACIIRTRAELVYWKNGVTLWTRAVAVTRNNFLAHYCLGNVLWSSNPRAALAEYEEAVALYPDYDMAQFCLAAAYERVGRLSESAVHYEKAAQLDPQNSWSFHALGLVLSKMGRPSDAVPPLLNAAELDPHNATYKDDLNRVLFFSDREGDAVSNFLAAVRSDPASFSNFWEAAKSDTNRFILFNNLAWSFATDPHPGLRNTRYAVSLATRACEMTGYKTNFCLGTLAAAYAADSRFDEAVATEQLACSLASAAGETNLLESNQALINLYQAHKPYHEPVQSDSP